MSTDQPALGAGPRVGCDIQSIAPVAESMARLGERYLRAVFGTAEFAHLAEDSKLTSPESVAARFAAKEAVLKVLAPAATDAVPWPSIAMHTGADGAPRLSLTDSAAALATRRGLGDWAVSMSHDGDYALAVAFALSCPPDPSTGALHAPFNTMTTEFRRLKGAHPMETTTTELTVRKVLAEHGKLSQDAHTLDTDVDLYRAGMTSHASVNVMLGLEDEFDIEFPEELLTKATFTSISSISEAVEGIDHD